MSFFLGCCGSQPCGVRLSRVGVGHTHTPTPPGRVSLCVGISLGGVGGGSLGRVSLLARNRLKTHLMIRTALAASVIGYAAFLQQLQWVLCFPSLLIILPQGRGRRLRMTMKTYLIAETVWKILPSFHMLNSQVRTASPVLLAKALAAFPQVTAPLRLKHKKKILLICMSNLARMWNPLTSSFCFPEQVNELVALIPYSDQRLRPQRT